MGAIGGVAGAIAACDGAAEDQGGNGGNGGFGGAGCSQGTFSIYAELSGSGFGHADGTAVRATFGRGSIAGVLDATTSIQDGQFQVVFDSPSQGCNLGASRDEPIALYIDVDGNGACDLAADEVFVASASGGPRGGRNEVALSPSVDHCAPSPVDRTSQLDAIRRLCPDVGYCLPFCRDVSDLACPAAPDAAAEDASTSPDAAN